ncbi:MAG: MBL fold metallo-hydrolase [Deltaproteobacteria bacterium]|nr:MBL fold metallo-hydrolase [Deltaproteobacteria bacterium]MBW2019234.1 MBL fold metallo-hydrolase [Deltaproteobacteria bacterium]MBW2074040.1 MBL fold metallo-hydrolase [Deltaproteobacteria bacterium]RLB82517.1 MAG: MBL fold metallo-hydrolase [Deltaproteobacteria bacterium]
MKVTDNLHAFIWRDITTNNCNTYLIDGPQKILIDPGHRHLFSHVRQGLADLSLSPDQIDLVIVTHGHPDHLEAVQMFEKPTLVAISYEENRFIKDLVGPYAPAMELDSFKPDFFLQEGDLTVGDCTFQVIHTPGHSPGSICLYWPDYKVLFTGDVVFSQGIGRTDLPGGNSKLLKESIQRIAALDATYLLAGHGEIVSGRKSVKANFRMIESQWFGYLL